MLTTDDIPETSGLAPRTRSATRSSQRDNTNLQSRFVVMISAGNHMRIHAPNFKQIANPEFPEAAGWKMQKYNP